ncbi:MULTISPECIES: SMP-30/gluconolactonase/LRE family protein [unclassified Pseudoxanthomonas]|uniref:SMP-30/gluconolactonase/LRE family protein n=1 Tax=unclassified Pseudoxanthomonas TaxID=2645906 RepID=UPI0008E58A78|nr:MULTISPECIES: SMP-30/gluconolactonase/LRE family protein [unclassified Pseudoxanthomonas]PPJ41100.1 SMP-30/gluconolactonase/LRE family protein [Pseudoxanthomonas sp. KAs_5_3]SFV31253.1 gluconolactonase [Pseudoxanthomonas sp. YR558]
MPLHRLTLALLVLCGTTATNASAQHAACPADPGIAPRGELTATRVAIATPGDAQDRLYEGPVWRDGALYLSDFVHNGTFPSRIRRFTPPDRWETVLEDSGSNGLALDQEGVLIAATHDRKQIARVDLGGGSRTALVSTFDDEPFNSPNDLVMAADGTLYFTDPDYQRKAAPGGQPLTRVYRHRNGATTVVDDTLRNPNGIALSPDGGTLYVAGGTAEGDVLRAYPVVDGAPGPGRDLARISGGDGLAVDCLGNVYVTEHGERRVRVFSPAGEVLATIRVDANITNAAFGGADRRTLFLTGAASLWSIDLDVVGLPY